MLAIWVSLASNLYSFLRIFTKWSNVLSCAALLTNSFPEDITKVLVPLNVLKTQSNFLDKKG